MKKALLFLLLIVCSPGFSATITAAAGGGNWSSTGTWVGAATPTAADDVVLAITSGSVTVDTGTCLAQSVTATAFVNNLTFNAGQTLTISGNVQLDTVASGMRVNGTGVLVVNNTSNFLSGGQTITGSLGFSGNHTFTLADSFIVNGDFLILSASGTEVVNGQTVTVGGSLTASSGTIFTGSTIIVLNGSGNIGGAGTFSHSGGITINTSGAVTISTLNVGNNFNLHYVAGTVNTSGGQLATTVNNFTALMTLDTGSMHWNNIRIGSTSGASSVTLQSQLIADGAISFVGSATAEPITFTGAFNTTCNELDIEPNLSLKLTAGVTLIVNNKILASGSNGVRPSISSITASSSIFLKYLGACAGQQSFFLNMTDVDASSSAIPITIFQGSTLTRTTNIVTGTFTNQNCNTQRGFIY